jgi:hypothetical protein
MSIGLMFAATWVLTTALLVLAAAVITGQTYLDYAIVFGLVAAFISTFLQVVLVHYEDE